MTGSNHLVTGALIGAVISQPVVAIPVAFISHFVLDTLPHYGHEHDERYWLTKGYTRVLVTDISLMALMVGSLIYFQPVGWALILVCGIVSLLPDLLWIPYYLHDRRHPESKPRKRIDDVLKRIQLGERPWGIYVEIAWLLIFGSILLTVVK